MPVLLQICAVIVTIAIAAIAIATVRAMGRFEKVAAEFQETAQAARTTLADVHKVTDEIRQLVNDAGEVVPRFKAVMHRFEQIGERTAQLSSDLLEQVEAPVRTAVAISRGVRRGTWSLFDRLKQRFALRRSPMNGGMES